MSSIDFLKLMYSNVDLYVPQGWNSQKYVMGGGGWLESESLRLLFLEAVYGFRVSFLSLQVYF